MSQTIRNKQQIVAITGATGLVGRYLCRVLAAEGYLLRCWKREESDTTGLGDLPIEWRIGQLGNAADAAGLVNGCDMLVHAGFYRENPGFQGSEGDLETFAQRNILGSLQLFEAALANRLSRTVYVSSCSVHEIVLDDRPLDETHPLWQRSHYGAHKAAVEQFVHSYGFGYDLSICALRPCSIYGLNYPPESSEWFKLVQSICSHEPVHCEKGKKCVHALDVARAILLLLESPTEKISGQSFACYDRYIDELTVAKIAQEHSNSNSKIAGQHKQPKHEIVTDKLRGLGFQFGGDGLLRETIAQLIEAADGN